MVATEGFADGGVGVPLAVVVGGEGTGGACDPVGEAAPEPLPPPQAVSPSVTPNAATHNASRRKCGVRSEKWCRLVRMRRLQVMIEEDAYEALGAAAAKARVSKASLVRRYVRLGLAPLPPLAEDPLLSLTGSAAFEPADIDSTLYGPSSSSSS